MFYPEKIKDEAQLEELLSIPHPKVVEMMKRLDGDLMILGIAGKMGVTMGRQAVEAIRLAGVQKKVYGVSRFSNPAEREKLESYGVETIACDLLDEEQIAKLPEVPNVVFMAGRKFGTEGTEALTWAMNTIVPENVGRRFARSRIVVFSTGCVYPLAGVESCGCTEEIPPQPIGEYSQSCLGRERIFQYCSNRYGTKILLFRLNYAVDLRYGVLHDIAAAVKEGRPVDHTVEHFNAIWQGDANAYALLSLELCDSPAAVLNVTGPEVVSVDSTALRFGKLFDREVTFSGVPGNRGYLSNAAKMCRLFGYPRVSMEQMILWQAQWLRDGGNSIGKPTHFEVSNGKF